MRRYILDNVQMWLADYHVDGLRLDAVHALEDSSDVHLLEEMAIEVAALSAHRRPAADPDRGVRPQRPHAGHAARGRRLRARRPVERRLPPRRPRRADRETDGYYADFEPLDALAKVIERGFFHDGTLLVVPRARPRPPDRHRNDAELAARGRAARTTTRSATAPSATGSPTTLDDDQLACAALLTLSGPFTPMLFQGEEWAASTPFQFFTSHPEPELGKATAEGRIAEFERMGWDPAVVPDPQDPETFVRSKLDWSELATGRHARMLDVYRRLAALRRERPELTDPSFAHNACLVDEDARLFEMWRGDVHVVVNFGDAEAVIELDEPGELLFETESGVDLAGTTLTPAHAGAVSLPDFSLRALSQPRVERPHERSWLATMAAGSPGTQ